MERWCHNWSRNKAFWKNGVNLTTEAIYGTVKSLNLHVFGLEVFLIILKIEMGIIKVWQSTKIITTTTKNPELVILAGYPEEVSCVFPSFNRR